jgi:transcriptional regulator with XRE-family HTH domain
MPDARPRRLGRAIQQVRLDHGLTQEQLADLAGLSVRHLGDIERGAKDIRWTTLARIAEGLDVPVAEIARAYDQSGQ